VDKYEGVKFKSEVIITLGMRHSLFIQREILVLDFKIL
jgi:hypothetical protein